jgi:hypothetical protein
VLREEEVEASSRISSAFAPGFACESASLAASSFSRKRRETVT